MTIFDIPEAKPKQKFSYIKFSSNVVSVNCTLKIEKGCEVFLKDKESLADLLGFEKNKKYEEGIHFSPKRVDISNINRICIECDIF